MWYTKYSTDIVDIDMQHANIDTLLTLYVSAASDADSDMWLNHIKEAIDNHFNYEELCFGDSFPSDHKKSHNTIAEEIEKEIGRHKNTEINSQELILFLRLSMLEHVRDFDSHLKNICC